MLIVIGITFKTDQGWYQNVYNNNEMRIRLAVSVCEFIINNIFVPQYWIFIRKSVDLRSRKMLVNSISQLVNQSYPFYLWLMNSS